MQNNPVMLSAEEYEALIAASAERDALRGELRPVTAQRDLAEEKLRAYKHELLGASSEARHADQLGLFNEAEALATATDAPAREDVPGTSVAAHTRGKRGRKPFDPNLPREVVRHELPESERFSAHDGHALVEIGVETSEQLDVIPEQVRVVQHQRVKYACPCCDLGIKVTPAPTRIIPRGLLTESALAWIITGKYQYGMPLYRQATLLRRFDGDISSNTLAASVVWVGLATQPVINLMRDALLESDLIYGDETTLQVLKEPGRRPPAKSYLWAQVNGSGPPVRMFSYSPGRGAQHAQKLYGGVQPGTALMTDGYELYNGIAHDRRRPEGLAVLRYGRRGAGHGAQLAAADRCCRAKVSGSWHRLPCARARRQSRSVRRYDGRGRYPRSFLAGRGRERRGSYHPSCRRPAHAEARRYLDSQPRRHPQSDCGRQGTRGPCPVHHGEHRSGLQRREPQGFTGNRPRRTETRLPRQQGRSRKAATRQRLELVDITLRLCLWRRGWPYRADPSYCTIVETAPGQSPEHDPSL
nr:IS66 family transposase [Burkholderia semiarida]